MTPSAQKRLLLMVVLLANLILWVIPSKVVELIARDRHVILGRYSREHFTWILFALIASVIALYIGLGSAARKKKRAFQVLATLLIGLPLVFVLDLALTITDPDSRPAYVVEGLAYHRRPESQEVTIHLDRPTARRSYPRAPAEAGFGRTECTLTADQRGYRNQTDEDHYDVVVLGDSFAEGSQVSDQQTWPVLLARRSGLKVYNLGMSGYDPQHYLAALQKYAPALKPKLVICLLYEGNDFRSARWVENPEDYRLPAGRIVQYYIRHSRVLGAVDGLMCGLLGAVNADGDVPGGEILSWLPLRIEGGGQATYYAFSPKRMVRHYVTEQEFRQDDDWKTTVRILGEMRKVCDSMGAALLMAYAPDKPHVTMPLAEATLPAEQVRAFAALKMKQLPEADAFLEALLARLGSKEAVTHEFCQTEGIPYVNTTTALRDLAARGRQAYYTYDQHWTPLGHQVVAKVVHDYLQGPLAAALSDTAGAEGQKATIRPASAVLPAGE